jgi:cytochrome c
MKALAAAIALTGLAVAGPALAEKVKKRGQGAWGPVPMPPSAAVPDADIKQLVDWILKMG